jgi:hypothetical protein
MVESNSPQDGRERVTVGALTLASVLFLLIGSGSAVAQAIVFPSVETSLGPLIGLWLVTAVFYFTGALIPLLRKEPLPLGIFFVASALTAVALVGTIATYVLTAKKGVSGLEYLALSAYAFFLGIIVLIVLTELSRK